MVEVFFKVIIVDDRIGKVKYHAIRVEFLERGNPHIFPVLWVLDAPILTKDNVNEYRQFIASIAKASLPDTNEKNFCTCLQHTKYITMQNLVENTP